jgi:hypothetical protein
VETLSTTTARQLLLALVQQHRFATAAQIAGALLMCVPTLAMLWRGNFDSPAAIFMLGFSGLFVLGGVMFLFSARRFRKRTAELRCLQQSGIVLAATLVKVGVVGDRAQAIGKPVRFALTLQWQHSADLTVRQFKPGNPISRRALASLLNPQEIFLNRQYTWVLRSIGKSPVNSKSCAIIAPPNGISGLQRWQPRRRQTHRTTDRTVACSSRLLSTVATRALRRC